MEVGRGRGAVRSTEEAHDCTWEQRSLEPWEAYNKLSMDATRRVGGTRTLTRASLRVNGRGRAGFGRRVVLYSRILSQLMVRPITDSGHRAFETLATNLHPSPFFPFMRTGISV